MRHQAQMYAFIKDLSTTFLVSFFICIYVDKSVNFNETL